MGSQVGSRGPGRGPRGVPEGILGWSARPPVGRTGGGTLGSTWSHPDSVGSRHNSITEGATGDLSEPFPTLLLWISHIVVDATKCEEVLVIGVG